LAWGASVVGLFSLSASKLLTYVLPAFPPAAFLVARWWTIAFTRQRERIPFWASAEAAAWTGAALSGLVAATAIATGRSPKYTAALPGLEMLAAVLILGAIAGVVAARAGRLGWFAVAQAAVGVGLIAVGVHVVVPAIAEGDSTRGLVAALRARGLDDRIAGAYRVPDVSLDFYLGRAVPRENDPAAWARRVAADPDKLWVVASRDIDRAAAEGGLLAEPVVEEGRRSVVRLRPR